MKSLKEGIALDTITLIKGADKMPINMMILSDDGEAIDITGDTVEVELHPRSGRIATPSLVLTGVHVVETAGTFTLTPTDVETDTLDVGRYNYWVKWTEAGGTIYEDGPGEVIVK